MTLSVQPIPEQLLTPVKIGRLSLPNRVIMAPMTRCRVIDVNVLDDAAELYYAQRAAAGLIITEATQPSEGAQGYYRTPGIHNDRQFNVWRSVTSAVHARGGRVFLQLWHTGRIFHPDNTLPHVVPVGPSAIAADVNMFTPNGLQRPPVPEALSISGIKQIVADFASAAQNAIDCGFDGVEIHAANGYLLDQFMNRSSNQRTDIYGGSVRNRTRIVREVLVASARVIGADRVGLRISPLGVFNDVTDPEPAEIYQHIASDASRLDLAYLHVIRPNVSGAMTMRGTEIIPDPLPEIRQRYLGTLIVAGDFDVESAEETIRSGLADCVAFGRWFISNPDLVERLANGIPLAQADHTTFYTSGAKGYTDYPSASQAQYT